MLPSEIKKIIKLANHLDNKGLYKEADCLDQVLNIIKTSTAVRPAYLSPNEQIAYLDKAAPQYGLTPLRYGGGSAYMLPSDSKRKVGIFVGTSGGNFIRGRFNYIVQKSNGQINIIDEGRGFKLFGVSQGQKRKLDSWLKYITDVLSFNYQPPPVAPEAPPVDPNSNPPPEDNEYYDDEEYSGNEITGYEERPAAQTRQPASATPEAPEALDPDDISITKNHNLPIEDVKQKIDAVVNRLNRRLGAARLLYRIQVSNISGTWDGSRYSISQPCSGFAEVNDSTVHLVLYLSEKPDLIQHRQTIIDEINSAIRSEFS